LKAILKYQTKKTDDDGSSSDNKGNLAEIYLDDSIENPASINPACGPDEVNDPSERFQVVAAMGHDDDFPTNIGNIIADPGSSLDNNKPVIYLMHAELVELVLYCCCSYHRE
jgi:hypothetical protein